MPAHLGFEEYDVATQIAFSHHYWVIDGQLKAFSSAHRVAFRARPHGATRRHDPARAMERLEPRALHEREPQPHLGLAEASSGVIVPTATVDRRHRMSAAIRPIGPTRSSAAERVSAGQCHLSFSLLSAWSRLPVGRTAAMSDKPFLGPLPGAAMGLRRARSWQVSWFFLSPR